MGQEFVISDGQKGLVELQKQRIQKLYDVTIALAYPISLPSDYAGVSASHEREIAVASVDKVWVEITGHNDGLCAKAMEYVLSLSQKEQTYSADFLDRINQRLQAIEKRSGALISRPKADKLVFVGSEEQIASALSLIQTFPSSINMHDLVALQKDTLSSVCIDQADGHNPTQSSKLPASSLNFDYTKTTLLGGTACVDGLSRWKPKVDSVAVETKQEVRDGSPYSDSSKSFDILIHMVKLGYKLEDVKSVLQKLGPNSSTNDVLSALIKHPDSSDPRIAEEREFNENFAHVEVEPTPEEESDNLRPIMIDGSNIAMSYGRNQQFDCQGIKLVVDFFLQRGHTKIYAFIPQYRKEKNKAEPTIGQDVLRELEHAGYVTYTPSRRIGSRRIVSYDDRYVLDAAIEFNGIVVSNDHFRDFLEDSERYRKVIEEQLLMYTFVEDLFMPTQDPLGKRGPKLDDFLKKKPSKTKQLQACPYGSRCTFGGRCKYHHPERKPGSKTVTQILDDIALEQLSATDKSDGKVVKSSTAPLPGFHDGASNTNYPVNTIDSFRISPSKHNTEQKSNTSPLPQYPQPPFMPLSNETSMNNAGLSYHPGVPGPTAPVNMRLWADNSNTDLAAKMELMKIQGVQDITSQPNYPTNYPIRYPSSPMTTSKNLSHLDYSRQPPSHSHNIHSNSSLMGTNSSMYTQWDQSIRFDQPGRQSRGIPAIRPQLVAHGPHVPRVNYSHPSASSSSHVINQSGMRATHASSQRTHSPHHYPYSMGHGGYQQPPIMPRHPIEETARPLRYSQDTGSLNSKRENIFNCLLRMFTVEIVKNVMTSHPGETDLNTLMMYCHMMDH